MVVVYHYDQYIKRIEIIIDLRWLFTTMINTYKIVMIIDLWW